MLIVFDTRRKKLQGVAKVVPGKEFTFMCNYISEVSKYLTKDEGT